MYRLEVVEAMVYSWTSEGQGDYLHSKQGYTLEQSENLDDIMAVIAHMWEVSDEDISDCREYISISIVEDEQGERWNRKEQGAQYLVEYTLQITQTSPIVLFADMFEL